MKQALLLGLFAGTAWAAPPDEAEIGRRVQAILRAHQADVFGCVQAAQKPPSGEVLVRVFAGGARGESVEQAEVLKDESGSPEVGRCVVAKMRSWDLASLEASPGDQLVFPLAFRPGTEPPAARIEHVTVAAGSPRELARGPEQAIYVLDGPVQANQTKLATGDVLWLPAGAACKLSASKHPAQILKIEGTATGGSDAAPATVRAGAVKALPIAGGKGSAKLFLDETRATLAVDELTAEAGVKIPLHRHEGSDELIHVVSGKGVTTIAGKDTPVGPGVTLRIPAGVEHSLAVDEKLIAVQVYAPKGPEQRFKAGKQGPK